MILLLPSFFAIDLNSNKKSYGLNAHYEIQPSPDYVYNEIETLSGWYRYLDTSGHQAAENYIFSKFESFGLNTSRLEYTCHRPDGDVRGCNVLGLLDGTLAPELWLVVGGHYDANMYATSGAYDNAAGAAAMLELARVFTEYFKGEDGPIISILFAAWDAEEGGGSGCRFFVENIPEGVTVVANINLDMFSLNYPVKNSIPGSSEEYFKLNLYTSPVHDFSGYSSINFNESTIDNFTIFQELLNNITYTQNNYPSEWVIVMDDTEIVSDHSHFIRNSIPAVWFRGMNEYPRDSGDINERNFKHTPIDTLETMERYSGGKGELLKGIDTGLTIAYQLILGILELQNIAIQENDHPHDHGEWNGSEDYDFTWLIALGALVIIFVALYLYTGRP
jgi:hypothetical protein